MSNTSVEWIRLSPPMRSDAASRLFVDCARRLSRITRAERLNEEKLSDARKEFRERAECIRGSDRAAVLASILLLSDLCVQGWELREQRGQVDVRPPRRSVSDPAEEKERIRRQELISRNAQLRQPAVKKFIESMEAPRTFNGRRVSIFSLMRDGRDLADALEEARKHVHNGWAEALVRAVDPYLQVIDSAGAVCEFTGLRLQQVWRYFRHTWTNQHLSTPGRSMQFLVRDRAREFHPVIGIGALASPIVQIRARDAWIRWQLDQFLSGLPNMPSDDDISWLEKAIQRAIDETYSLDLIEEGVLSRRDLRTPGTAVIEKLTQLSIRERNAHQRFSRSRDYKQKISSASRGKQHWEQRARTHLFKSKRSLSLATFLEARRVLNAYKESCASRTLSAFAATRDGMSVITKVLKKVKSDQVGIALADISVCGAVQPYNSILGGKLVAMLSASPEIVANYRRKYGKAESEIASSIAGRAVVRDPNLVLLGTTSLYGGASSQYNRIKIPCERLGGKRGENLVYKNLGFSESYGTSQFSEETMAALTTLVQQRKDGIRVNSIFGEGVNPKMRKARSGIDLLSLPSALLLKHFRHRTIYAVSLVRNLSRYLLGFDARADFLFDISNPTQSTKVIAEWWQERWLKKRIQSDEVLHAVRQHTLIRPIRHGARVPVFQGDASIENRQQCLLD